MELRGNVISLVRYEMVVGKFNKNLVKATR